MRKFYYVYELLDEEGVPFYVGKGSGMRMFMHEKQVWKYRTRSECQDDKERKIFDIQESEKGSKNWDATGYALGYRIVFTTYSEREAYRVENGYINKTPGLLNTKRKGAAREDWERRMEITRKFMEKVRRNRATSN